MSIPLDFITPIGENFEMSVPLPIWIPKDVDRDSYLRNLALECPSMFMWHNNRKFVIDFSEFEKSLKEEIKP